MTGTVVGAIKESSYTAGSWKLDLTDGTNTITLYYVPITGTPTEGCTITVTGKLTAHNGSAQFDETATAKVEGGTSAPEQGGENTDTPVADGKVTYKFSNYTAGTQYAMDEVHTLDDKLTVTISDGHFNTQLRLYDSSSHNANAVLKTATAVKSLALNAGNKAANLEVYGSTNGTDWVLIDTIETKSSYADYTVNIPADTAYTYIKLDAVGDQIRVASVTFGF